jgi:hypothetical protein
MKKNSNFMKCGVIFLAVSLILIIALVVMVILLYPARSLQQPLSQPEKIPDLAAAVTTTPTPNAAESFLSIFPLRSGATWTYSDTEYDTLPGQPDQVIQAVFEITDQVMDVKTSGSDYIAHVQQKVKKVKSDEGWSDLNHSSPAEYDFWYIYHDQQIYTTRQLPAEGLQSTLDMLTLEYQFPMAQNAQWCPDPLTEPAQGMDPTPFPCQYAGMRIIQGEGPQQTLAGTFQKCYQMADIYNGGGMMQTFCDGIGVVERRYDHAGTHFGFLQILTGFTP